MIEKSEIEKMDIAGLTAMFSINKESMDKLFKDSAFIKISGLHPERVIDDLFNEMKQIWLKKIELEESVGK